MRSCLFTLYFVRDERERETESEDHFSLSLSLSLSHSVFITLDLIVTHRRQNIQSCTIHTYDLRMSTLDESCAQNSHRAREISQLTDAHDCLRACT